eukprot:CAMPEP_0176414206 /NCGR_PEP_ID=MMETSP0127-20121128/5133_1 /TAXON_ID=938130 /ORGANISM="Platyophrya macrostoma, Strain WH" /LENGTH=551 /DNA_ID=CAMNT_0017794087 /DNA_START=49 /DNA_END=1704 /DNA_ORIENTATION=-
MPKDTYTAAVDNLLDELREAVLTSRPENVPSFLQQRLSSAHFVVEAPPAESLGIHQKYPAALNEKALSIVVLGITGDLAKKKTIPALFKLFREGLIPTCSHIVGYARSEVQNLAAFRETFTPYLGKVDPSKELVISHFLSRITYVQGSYDKVEDFTKLDQHLREIEAPSQNQGNRLFYLALPPTVFVGACTGIRQAAMPQTGGWVRVIVEKPFGRDTASSNLLSQQLSALFSENQIFRIDHYLGKEMVQNIVTTRFANRVFASLWNNNNIANVQITFKEKIGTEGRGGYFDNFGIIRDVIQNHLTQILALVGMEKPRSLNAEDIRDEKVALLRCVEPVKVSDCVLGQYTASPDGKIPGYLEDPTVPKGSKCPTFAIMRLNINNDRWRNVPFIIKAGKALESKAVSIRIQFHEEVRPFLDKTQRNELVIRAQPNESMYIKITTKTPGLGMQAMDTHQTELDLTYQNRYQVDLPDAYESLISEAIFGSSTNFVRSDELEAAWEIFTPLLHAIDRGEVTPTPYVAGSRGPAEADKLTEACGYRRYAGYQWDSKI